MSHCFAAIDFETANNDRSSACAVGLVRVEDGAIVAWEHRFIRPPTDYFLYADFNGIRPQDVAGAPAFGEVWRELEPLLDGAEFIAAHNAVFDKAVLYGCCEIHKIRPPSQRFVCTVKAARACWGLAPATLDKVCSHLGIDLNHHEALSDAMACAQIMMKAIERGYRA